MKPGPETILVADGFSCREQIEQGTGRPTRHLAEVIAEGMGFDPVAELRKGAGAAAETLALAGGTAILGFLAAAALTRRNREPAPFTSEQPRDGG